MKLRKYATVGVAALAAFTLAACSQGNASGGEKKDSTQVEQAKADAPAPFDKDGVKIAIVQQSGQGDYFQQFLNGVNQQSKALNVKVDAYDAQGDNAKQASQLDQAIAAGVDGIIVRHGYPDTLCQGVNDAIDKDIPIVIYDVEIQKCAPDAVQTQQSDADMAGLVLDQMKKDIGSDQKVGYVNVSGIAPLDRRDKVWKEQLKANKWDQQFKTGTYTDSTATDSAPMVSNALKSHSDVQAIYAPFDEFSKGTLSALEQNSSLEGKIKVYGADISTADIELMTAENSPWVATGATDPNAIGAAVMRTLSLDMAGELDEKSVDFPPILVTQDFLVKNKVKNMDDLREAEPKLNISDASSADWIPVVKF
jgi:simple sugar transport system substrate-binding protein